MNRRAFGTMLLVTAPIGCGTLFACSAVLGGIDPGVLLDGSPEQKESGVEAGMDAGRDQVLPGDAKCGTPVDLSMGVLVSASSGQDTMMCGSKASPCQTIQHGLTQAFNASKPFVYVAQGLYVESITLHGGSKVLGGYNQDFAPVCGDPEARARSVVVMADAMSNITVSATGLTNADALMQDITIKSKATADAGESLYGLFASGNTATVTLKNVIVEVANAGDGAAGGMGSSPGMAAGNCGNGSGAMGMPQGTDGNPAQAGQFSDTGYTPGDGATGGDGTAGGDGTVESMPTCVQCITCGTLCAVTKTVMSCGKQGNAGCGGGPGKGGSGGGGGGSSVGVYAWMSPVDAIGGSITAGSGGAGGKGGPGGTGGNGGMGSTGGDGSSCTISCAAVTCTTSVGEGTGGKSGAGGDGSGGGTGGGGSGGYSYAVYQDTAGNWSSSGTTTKFGTAGAGRGGAPAGKAAAVGGGT